MLDALIGGRIVGQPAERDDIEGHAKSIARRASYRVACPPSRPRARP